MRHWHIITLATLVCQRTPLQNCRYKGYLGTPASALNNVSHVSDRPIRHLSNAPTSLIWTLVHPYQYQASSASCDAVPAVVLIDKMSGIPELFSSHRPLTLPLLPSLSLPQGPVHPTKLPAMIAMLR